MLYKKELLHHFVILSTIILAIFILPFLGDNAFMKMSEGLHADIELFGAVVAIITSIILYLKLNIRHEKYLIALIMSFISMGVLDGLHSHLNIGNTFVLSHSIASLYGSLFAFLVWFPSVLEYMYKRKLIFFLFAFVFSLLTALYMLYIDSLPSYLNMLSEAVVLNNRIVNKFTLLAVFINVFSGVLFILSSIYFYGKYIKDEQKTNFLFFLFFFLTGMAEVIFEFSVLWSFDWWLWHIIRLVAYVVVLFVLIYDYHVFLKFILAREKELRNKNMLIEEHSNLLQHIYDINPNILFTSDGKKDLHSVNRSFLEFTGFSTLEKFKKEYECICDMFVDREGYLSKEMDDGTLWVEHVIKHPKITHKVLIIKNGEEHKFKVSATKLGKIESLYIISLSEITDIENIREQAEASSKAKSTFLSNMSHEIRTPLNGIIGLTKLALDTQLTSKQEYYLSRVEITSKSLLQIINEILDYSKVQAGKINVHRDSFNILYMLEHIAGLFSYEVEKKGIELLFHVDKDIPYGLIGDQIKITQVLINLIGNAVKFTHSGEVILDIDIVSKGDEKCKLKFEVKDTGIGISQDNIDNLFKEFSQVDDSYQRRYGGTGLGLTISKHFVELMGGDISVESVYGEGSTFSFSLEFDVDKKMIEDFNIRNIKKDDRVLIVDDNATSREIMYDILQSWNLEVDSGRSGIEAIKKVDESIEDKTYYNFMIIDWKMPGLSGVETILKIKELYKLKSVSQEPTIIMITSYLKDELLEQLQSQNLSLNIITKPLTPSTIYNAMTNQDQKTASQITVKKYDNDLLPIYGAEVLLVEDNEINQIIVKDYIEAMNLNVTIANNGQEAIYYVENNMFDIILMDIQMPVMDGIRASKKIKKISDKNAIPIIAMSAATMDKDKKDAKDAGMAAHIPKPIDAEELKQIFLKYIKHDKKGRKIKNKKQKKQKISNTALVEKQDIHGLNFDKLMDKLSHNNNLAIKLLLNFAKKYENVNEMFNAEVVGSDKFNHFIHSLKGESGNLAVEGVYNLARLIDERDDLDKKMRFVNPLHNELLEVTKSIKDRLDTLKTDNSSLDNIAQKSILDILDELIVSIDERYVIPFESIQELLHRLEVVIEDKEIEKLSELFEQLDYKSVKVVLNDIKKKLSQDG